MSTQQTSPTRADTLEKIKFALVMHATNELIRSGKAPKRTKAWDGAFLVREMSEALGMALAVLAASSPSSLETIKAQIEQLPATLDFDGRRLWVSRADVLALFAEVSHGE